MTAQIEQPDTTGGTALLQRLLQNQIAIFDTIAQAGKEWFAEWQPRTMKAGWKYWATIVPESLAAAGTLMPIMEELYNLGLRMMVFTDMEQAIAWLDKMNDA